MFTGIVEELGAVRSFDGDRLRAVVSLHQLSQCRRWSSEDVAAASTAAEEVERLL